MAKRPVQAKKIRRLEKLMRRTPPAFIDLVQWLKLRGHARTTGAAYRLMAEGKVLSGDHVIGRERVVHEGEVGWLPSPRVEARHRDHLRVAA